MEDTFDFGLLRGGINFFGVYDGHAGLRAVNVCTSTLFAAATQAVRMLI